MKKLILIAAALALAGCAGKETLKQGQYMIEAGNEEQGLARLEEALKANPNDTELRKSIPEYVEQLQKKDDVDYQVGFAPRKTDTVSDQ
jgi:uncharacterized lipoprotein YmbA